MTASAHTPMGWVAYAVAWIAATLFWSLASASSAGTSPLVTAPWGARAMGAAAVMGVAVWHMTRRVPIDWRAPAFYAVHAASLVVFAIVYTTSWIWVDLVAGRAGEAFQALRTSPVTPWNLLMGSWLYLVVAGLSYAIRAQRRLRAEESAAAEARLLAQQAQLAALRAQINPHFLYNALHSVGALVTTDPDRADRALERLGDLLRYVLGAEDEVPLRSEWRFTQDYLAFEQLRLGDRLRVAASVDEAALGVLVPPLVLQPLVENAVRHGIADRPEGGRVSVAADRQADRLVLRVSDDGRGTVAGAGQGLGLTGVRRRLEAMYGARASVEIAQGATGYTVTLTLPARAGLAEDSAA